MPCIDGFVLAVPTANRSGFVACAREFDAIFLEYGASRVLEGWGDEIPDGKLTDFRRAVQAGTDETVVFSWIEWPDKASRDAGMAKVMPDPRMGAANCSAIFDTRRMIFGGFAPVVELQAGH